MNILDTFERISMEHDVGPHELWYYGLGIGGEAGEAVDAIKKAYRKEGLTPERRQQILLELGDALWYIRGAATRLGATLAEVMEMNMTKLATRRTGVLR